MDLTPYVKALEIDVMGKTIFMSNKFFQFSYTPAKDIVKDEFKDEYRYFGGLQCEFEVDSYEYKRLEKKLCEIAEAVLASLSLTKVKVFNESNQSRRHESHGGC